MRRVDFEMTSEAARALLTELPTFHLASTTPAGDPVLRTLHGVVVDDYLAFHGAPQGEKVEVVGRRAVIQAEEIVATVPSTFFHPEKACPATTYYRSVQIAGVVEALEAPELRARALQALMEKLQPEGGYVPIRAAEPLYRAALKNLLIAGVRLDAIAGKAKLAQNRRPEELTTLLASLWQRGAPGDARALELIRAANPHAAVPSFLAAPPPFTLHAWLPPSDADAAAALLADAYWNQGVFDVDELRRVHRSDRPWVGARDAAGRLVASARAVADGVKFAWVADVVVAPEHRGKGLGRAVMQLLLDHPELRRTRRVGLGTRDASSFYERLGFVDRRSLPPRGFEITEMVRSGAGVA